MTSLSQQCLSRSLAGFRSLPLPLAQLSLEAVLRCGQSFRWLSYPLNPIGSPDEPSHEYRFCLKDRVVCLRQSPTALFYKSCTADSLPRTPEQAEVLEEETLQWLKDYFQIDVDLVPLYDQWDAADPVFRAFRSRFIGIRVLRQDPWENLISFICSTNNNIPRITKMVQGLCKHYSPVLLHLPNPTSEEAEAEAYHPFPPPSALTGKDVPAKLRALGFGYRAEFVHRTAKMLTEEHGISCSPEESTEPAEKWLMGLREMETDVAREELLKFVGVGRKVADCVLLMSLDKRAVIPVDTHVHQIAVKHYGLSSRAQKTMTPKIYDQVSQKLGVIWGDYAGWAHTVLFTADLKSFASYGIVSPNTAAASVVLPTTEAVATKRPLEEEGAVVKVQRRRKR